MRLIIVCGAIVFVLSACTSRLPLAAGGLPPEVDDGIGSQYGNYEMRPAGETKDAGGNRCVIFNWDRPLNRNFVIRYSTESCESKEHPIWMNTTPYVRSVIPIAQSNLKNAQTGTLP